MSPELLEAREEAEAAKAALVRFLRPAFKKVQAGYLKRLQDVATSEPWAGDKIRNLALVQALAEQVQAHIETQALGLVVADHSLEHIRKIEKLSPERRRILGI